MGYSDVDFSKYIKNGIDPVILDIGSYDGSDAAKFKECYPGGKIFAIEASSRNMAKFDYSAGIEIRHLAIGDVNQKIVFKASYGPGMEGSGSILSPNDKMRMAHPSLLFEDEEVECMTIEKFCEVENLERIDCIHIDAQGAEIKILSSLGKFRPDCIYAETCEYEIYEGAGSLEELDALMESMGYRVEYRHREETTNFILDTLYVYGN